MIHCDNDTADYLNNALYAAQKRCYLYLCKTLDIPVDVSTMNDCQGVPRASEILDCGEVNDLDFLKDEIGRILL